MATFPVLKVEVAFVSNPLDTAPTWTDVTQYVRHANGVDITRGRSDPWSHFTAGRLTLTFSNRDRRFDSLYSAGPYFGNLKPGKQIRVTCTWSAVTYDLFRGFVGTWPQEFSNAGKDATVTVECYDGLEWAASVRLSTDPYETYLLSIGTPALWWRQADATKWDDRQDTYEPTTNGVGASVTASALPGLTGSQAVNFNGSVYYSGISLSSGKSTLGFWIKTTATTGTIIDSFVLGLGLTISLTAGKLFYSAAGSPDSMSTTSSVAINDGLWHFICYTFQSDASIATTSPASVLLYIDSVLDTAPVTTSSGSGSNSGYFIKRVGANMAGTPISATSMQDLFALPSVTLTASQISTLYGLGLGYRIEDSGTRIGRYLDDAGWPSTWRDITTTPAATVDTMIYNGQQLVTSLQELESSEQGRIFVSKSGNMTLQARYFNNDVTRGNTSQATFTDDGSAFTYRDFGYTQDDTDVRNDITVTNTAGLSRSSDSTSITANRRRSETVNTILSTVDQRQGMAAGLVTQWKDAQIRVKQFTAGVPANWASLLNLEIGDRITVKQTPMGVGSQFSKDLIIDSIGWRIDAAFWEMHIAAAPVTPTTATWFVLDTSSLDGTDVLGY